ncbi:hypothetical protein RUM44_002540 [Polyplax serrata]|uniref:Uncharacterized protein n=1 Tax=Polyplax serrata TaxID=468196 RepID=A0ABR1AF27_POLSC
MGSRQCGEGEEESKKGKEETPVEIRKIENQKVGPETAEAACRRQRCAERKQSKKTGVEEGGRVSPGGWAPGRQKGFDVGQQTGRKGRKVTDIRGSRGNEEGKNGERLSNPTSLPLSETGLPGQERPGRTKETEKES